MSCAARGIAAQAVHKATAPTDVRKTHETTADEMEALISAREERRRKGGFILHIYSVNRQSRLLPCMN